MPLQHAGMVPLYAGRVEDLSLVVRHTGVRVVAAGTVRIDRQGSITLAIVVRYQ